LLPENNVHGWIIFYDFFEAISFFAMFQNSLKFFVNT